MTPLQALTTALNHPLTELFPVYAFIILDNCSLSEMESCILRYDPDGKRRWTKAFLGKRISLQLYHSRYIEYEFPSTRRWGQTTQYHIPVGQLVRWLEEAKGDERVIRMRMNKWPVLGASMQQFAEHAFKV